LQERSEDTSVVSPKNSKKEKCERGRSKHRAKRKASPHADSRPKQGS